MSVVHDWGSTSAERSRSYACDRYVQTPSAVCFRAVDVAAPASLAFRWLCQLRIAPYSYDWIDNYGRSSPTTRDPANERLERGDRWMRIFELAEYERDQQLTLRMVGTRMFGALAVTYSVLPRTAEQSRFVVKLAFRLSAWSPMRWLLPAGDLVMMRKQLLTLKRLAEREHLASAAQAATR
jgi:hypothetical protein